MVLGKIPCRVRDDNAPHVPPDASEPHWTMRRQQLQRSRDLLDGTQGRAVAQAELAYIEAGDLAAPRQEHKKSLEDSVHRPSDPSHGSPGGEQVPARSITAQALSRERRGSHLRQNRNRHAPLVGLQRRVMRRLE